MSTRKGSGERVTLSMMRDAHLSGDFERCLTMSETFPQRDSKDATEVVLLRARCLISLGRGEHALEALRALRLRDSEHDEYLTGRTLMSAAYVALGKYDESLKIAREAYEEVDGAHSTVRAELMLNYGIAYYRKGEYAKASRLLDAIPETEDIIYVRALQFRGGVAWANNDFAGSLDKFREAFAYLDKCRYRDRFTEARLLFSLAYLCAQLPRLDLWPEVSNRIEQFDWSASGVATWRYWIAIESSYAAELLGDLGTSAAYASLAEEVAPDSPSLIVAWCRLAECFGRNGEKHAHAYFTAKATRKYDAIPRDGRLREQWPLPLDIAEEVLYSDAPLSASRLVTYYDEVIAPIVRGIGAEGRTIESRRALVLGLLEDQRGNRSRAEQAYRRAFDLCRAAGLMRSASIVAYRLLVLTGDEQYAAFVTAALAGVSETYWVKARLARGQTEARLTARQLEVVRLVAQGKTDKEIAAARGISFSRARNAVAEIRAVLGVRSRTELATVAAARGLLSSPPISVFGRRTFTR
jgi:DNA-binding CsgD family transcriptional regulator/tetratricopeptide (TPR) repeat protein